MLYLIIGAMIVGYDEGVSSKKYESGDIALYVLIWPLFAILWLLSLPRRIMYIVGTRKAKKTAEATKEQTEKEKLRKKAIKEWDDLIRRE